MYRTESEEDRRILVTAFGGKVYGLDRHTGQPVWTAQIEVNAGEVEIAIVADVVIACTPRRLIFIRYPTGEILRYVQLSGQHPRRPTMLVDAGQILIGRNGEVACYAPSGDVIWVQPFTGHGFGSVALAFPGNVRQADDVGSQ